MLSSTLTMRLMCIPKRLTSFDVVVFCDAISMLVWTCLSMHEDISYLVSLSAELTCILLQLELHLSILDSMYMKNRQSNGYPYSYCLRRTKYHGGVKETEKFWANSHSDSLLRNDYYMTTKALREGVVRRGIKKEHHDTQVIQRLQPASTESQACPKPVGDQ